MRWFLLFSGLLWINQLSYAQTGTTSIDYTTELQKMSNVPNSPEAQAFAQYGNTSVNLYRGQPDISIPIYEYQGREMNIPVTLTYDASGIKVDQLATQVGLGWNLQFGGRISRIVNGAPDDFIHASAPYETIMVQRVRDAIQNYSTNTSTFTSVHAATEYLRFLKDMGTGYVDAQPDFYNLNVPGISGHITFDFADNMQPRLLNNPRIRVAATFDSNNSISSWTVIGEDGTTYIFSEAEKTRYEGNDWSSPTDSPEIFGLTKDYNSSWVLKQIISPTGKDHYQINYTSFGYWNDFDNYVGATSITNSVCDNNLVANQYPINFGQVSWFLPKYKIDQRFPKQLIHNGKQVISFDLTDRHDMDVPSALDKIKIHHPINNNELLRTYNLQYSYFGIADQSSASTQDTRNIRLKLDKIAIQAENQTYQTYRFNYDRASLVPSRTSFRRDYLGYFNNKNNQVLYPRLVLGEDIYEGANRAPDGNFATIGTLNKIHYPTGGSTEFTYELPSSNRVVEGQITTINGNIGGNILIGGVDQSNADETPEYDQKWPNPPKISHTTFEVNKAGSFRIDFSTNGGLIEAHLFKIDGKNTTKKFNEIFYGNGSGEIEYIWDKQTSGSSNGIISDDRDLSVGHYQITLASINPNNHVGVQVYGEKIIRQPDKEVIDYKAGLRVKRIVDKDQHGKISLIKEYKYSQAIDSQVSSEKVLFEPKLIYYTSRLALIENASTNHCGNTGGNGIQTFNYVHRITSANSGNQPHVVYDRVFELRKDGIGTEAKQLGYTEYNFNTGRSGIISSGVPPNANQYLMDEKFGKLNESIIYNDQHDKLASSTYQYGHGNYLFTKGLYSQFDETKTYMFPEVYEKQGGYGLRYVNARIDQYNGAIIHGPLDPNPPASCDEPENTCIETLTYSPYSLGITQATGMIDFTTQVAANEFYYQSDGTVSTVTSITENTYDPVVDYLNTKTKVLGSQGDEVIQERYFPMQFNGAEYTNLVEDNRLTTVVEERNYKNGQEIGKRKLMFAINNGKAMPINVAQSINGPLENRIKYQYNEDHNLISAVQLTNDNNHSGDLNTSFLWGYNKRYIIAEVQNATPEELTMALGTSAGILDQDNPDAEQLRTILSQLRNQLPQALVTTYTYQYGAGVSSITDPNGVITQYRYDTMNRLSAIYINGEKIQEFDYHHITQE